MHIHSSPRLHSRNRELTAKRGDRELYRYAVDAWRSLEAMTFLSTGLPADNFSASGKRERRTKPTNIASSIWSAFAARDLNTITPEEAHQYIGRILDTLSRMEYHQPSGILQWYDPKTGYKSTVGPEELAILSASIMVGWLRR